MNKTAWFLSHLCFSFMCLFLIIHLKNNMSQPRLLLLCIWIFLCFPGCLSCFLLPSAAPEREFVPLLPWCPAAHLCLISGSAAAVLIQIVHRPCVSSSGSSMLPEIFLCLAAEVFTASPWDSSTRLPHRLTYLRNSLHCPATILGNEKLVVYNLCMRANLISINRNLEKQMLITEQIFYGDSFIFLCNLCVFS